jgi:quercetin dioxygenase-like cupin family protein
MPSMRTRFIILTFVGTIALLAIAGAGVVQATAPSGVVGTNLAVGTFGEIDAKTLTSDWQARIDTKGTSDLYMVQNVFAPGASFGWHSHPGPSLVIVKTGALTLYQADDPTCSPHVVPAGSGFVDDGHDTHLVRNEQSVETVVYVVSIVPQGAARRIDEPAPANCPAGLH